MPSFNQAQDPYTAALEVLVVELAGALINSGAVDGPAFTRRIGLYEAALEQGSNPRMHQGAVELGRLMRRLEEITPLTAGD